MNEWWWEITKENNLTDDTKNEEKSRGARAGLCPSQVRKGKTIIGRDMMTHLISLAEMIFTYSWNFPCCVFRHWLTRFSSTTEKKWKKRKLKISHGFSSFFTWSVVKARMRSDENEDRVENEFFRNFRVNVSLACGKVRKIKNLFSQTCENFFKTFSLGFNDFRYLFIFNTFQLFRLAKGVWITLENSIIFPLNCRLWHLKSVFPPFSERLFKFSH